MGFYCSLTVCRCFLPYSGRSGFFQFTWITKAEGALKKRSNRANFYKGCGILMWLCILLLLPMTYLESYRDYLSRNKIVFTVEVIALVAFGLSWLIKGMEKQLNDKND
jgi:hypothetical protein